jgi:hypothetical protein
MERFKKSRQPITNYLSIAPQWAHYAFGDLDQTSIYCLYHITKEIYKVAYGQKVMDVVEKFNEWHPKLSRQFFYEKLQDIYIE